MKTDQDKEKRAVKIKEHGVKEISFGVNTIDLSATSQLVDRAQTHAIRDALYIAKKRMQNNATLREVADAIEKDIAERS